jgi:uncharacterized protein (DUF885 family)
MMYFFLGLIASFVASSAGAAAPASADARFVALAHSYIERSLVQHPEDATSLGDHRYDARLADYAPSARARELAADRADGEKLRHIDIAQLTGANRVDAQLLQNEIERQIFTLTTLHPDSSDPLSYGSSYADGLYLLVARDFAPAAERLHSVAGRLKEIPRVLRQARANLQHPPRIYTETAIERVDGAVEQVLHGFDALLAQVPAAKAQLEPLQASAARALAEYREWLKADLLPRSDGDFRIGKEAFRQKLRYTLVSALSPEEILERAQADVRTTSDQIYAAAVPLYRKYFPEAGDDDLAGRHQVVKTVLDRLADNRPDQNTIVTQSETILREATDFVRSHELVTLPSAPVRLIVMPEFKRGASVAYCDRPGALETNGETFFAISPTPKTWSQARQTSFYREYNHYMLCDLTVHEAMPGHYLQGGHANQFKAPSLVRAVLQNGAFIEGWAVYGEQMMAEHGFGGPEVRMEQLKMRLRVDLNAIIDQKIHCDGMSENDAVALMENAGFQEEGEAVGKWKRAQLTSTQLSTYFVGVSEWLDLRASAQAKEGTNFNLKRFNDAAISFGSPPVKFVRVEMGL